MENKVWEGEGETPSCQETFQMPLSLPHLKSATRQEREPEQNLFSGKGQLGKALVCVRVELELWISVVPETYGAHTDCALFLPPGASTVPTDESLVTAQRAKPRSLPSCFQYGRPGFLHNQGSTTD